MHSTTFFDQIPKRNETKNEQRKYWIMWMNVILKYIIILLIKCVSNDIEFVCCMSWANTVLIDGMLLKHRKCHVMTLLFLVFRLIYRHRKLTEFLLGWLPKQFYCDFFICSVVNLLFRLIWITFELCQTTRRCTKSKES